MKYTALSVVKFTLVFYLIDHYIHDLLVCW